MPSILQRVLTSIASYTNWEKEAPINERTGQSVPSIDQSLPTIDQTAPPTSSYRQDITSFGELMIAHIQSGALTQAALDKAVQEHEKRVANNIERKRQEVIAEIDREIEATYERLPESQRQRFKDNVDRQARIDAKLKSPWDSLFSSEPSVPFSWQTDFIANIVKDPDLKKLAESIRIKEKSDPDPITYKDLHVFGRHPLGEPFAALRLQEATQSPEALQAFIKTIIENRNIWGTQSSYAMEPESIVDGYRNLFPLKITHYEDAYVLKALEKSQYTNQEISSMICNALLDNKLPINDLGVYNPIIDLVEYKSYIRKLSPGDSDRLKTHHAQQFALQYVVDKNTPINKYVFHEIETIVKDLTLVKKNYEDFSNEVIEEVTMNRLADVLLHGYDIDTLVPILEAYQGDSVLNGSLPAKDLVSDIRAYLNERTSTGQKNTLEVLSPFILGTATADMSAVFVQAPFDGKMEGWSLPSKEEMEKFAADAKAAGVELPSVSFDTDTTNWLINVSEESLAKAREQLKAANPSNNTPGSP